MFNLKKSGENQPIEYDVISDKEVFFIKKFEDFKI